MENFNSLICLFPKFHHFRLRKNSLINKPLFILLVKIIPIMLVIRKQSP